ncbi:MULTISPECIES: dihydrodipicolinate synthase family protein [Salinibaculum]|uniref:dihydrodipicolinate synthase family protein n=1 Tax=Salinibaculum TaxID=2732368 RepID=UPI0030D18232
MEGISPPLVTPFDETGALDEDRLRSLVPWLENRGIDFITPCGTNSEAELMTAAERKTVVEIVAEEASVPVLAGTGSPGLQETLEATEAAAAAGADAALVVTPFYYSFDQSELESYFIEVADSASLPIYLYSVPAFTGVTLAPETVGRLSAHPNIVGMKDSQADIAEFIRTRQRTEDEDFTLLVGSASVFAQALDAGGSGGVNAFANLFPERLAAVYEAHGSDPEHARELNASLVDLNTAITATYGIPGLKWAMRYRGAPAGYSRAPHTKPETEAQEHLQSLVDEVSE